MTKIEKKDAMESARMHHTIDAPRVGGAQDGKSAAAGKETSSLSQDTSRENGSLDNPGFDPRQPQELAPRDSVKDSSASDAGETVDATATSSEKTVPPGVVEGGTSVPGSALSREQLEQMTDDIIGALKTVYDPEIPADIYELGLIYKVDIKDNRDVEIDMTLTAPGCPVAGEMPQWVENAVRSVAGVGDVSVNLVFEPPWDMSRMSDEARLAINMF